tara:strand:- start:557 stop:1456 length:900 start_codon:yes stop_codon:yes gene_type:complete
MSLLNSSIATIMPYLPKWFARPFAKPYVAGETFQSVIEIVKEINNNGFSATIDILGEHVHSENEAKNILSQYSKLIKNISENNLDSTISVKLTHLGLGLSEKLAEENILELAQYGNKNNIGITIDMENSIYTSATLKLFKKALAIHQGLGAVIQAYLYRSIKDLKKLESSKLNLRICKGIYREPSNIAMNGRKKINENYLLLVKTTLLGKGYACIATHDMELINHLENFVEKNGISPNKFEFQVLFGVPMGNKLEHLKEKGYKVRIYVPFGEAWFDYSIRRLKENPKIISYIIGNIFKK